MTMTLNQFIEKVRWSPNGGLDSAANYMGPDLSAWCRGPSRSRDSEILEESNFEAALERLGGEREGIVEVHRFGHWACGWFESIMVNPKRKTVIKILKEIHDDLESYPVLDESDYSEREYKYFSDFAEDAEAELAKALVLHLGLPEELSSDKEMLEVAYQLNMECQFYYGSDSCINVYDRREPDLNDWDRVLNCLKQVGYGDYNRNSIGVYLCVAFGLNDGGAQ